MAEKKQNFLHGAILLTIAAAVVKLIGAFYKLPLQAAIGTVGYSYFTTAYDIYSVLLMVSTAGLPVAMSRMISQASSLGHYNQVRRIYSVSKAIFLGIGIVSTLLMMVGCHVLADALNQPDAWAAILCLGPCALLMGYISTYRGFFQGQGNMRPTSNSQMIEAVTKLLVGLTAAFVIMRLTDNVALAAGGAILGVTASCLVSAIYLRAKLGPDYRTLPQTGDEMRSFGATAKSLLAIAIPITIGSAGLQLLNVVEVSLYMDRLVYLIGSNQYMNQLVADGTSAQLAADSLKGIYDTARTVFNMPCAFIIPITISVIPAITSNLTLGKDKEVRETEESAARITGLLSLPCAVGLLILAAPVMSLLFGYGGYERELAGQLMAVLGVNVFFYAVIQYTNALLQSHGYAHVPVINTLISGVLKVIAVYILSGNPYIGILGAPIGAVACYVCISVLNLICVAKLIPQKPRLVRNLLRPGLSAAIMGVTVYLTHWGLSQLISADGGRGAQLVLCGGSIGVGVVVYFVCVVALKAIKKEDCMLLPKGEKLAKILHL